MIFLLWFLVVGTLQAMENEKSPLLSLSMRQKNETRKIIKEVQHTFEVSDHDAVTFDATNVSRMLVGTPTKGLVMYDTQKHMIGQSKGLPPHTFYSLRSSHDKNNKDLLLCSMGNYIAIYNIQSNSISSIETSGNSKHPSRIRFIPRSTNVIAFQDTTMNVYNSEQLYKNKFYTITNPQPIDGVAVSLTDKETVITWDDQTVKWWDLRQSSATHTLAVKAYAVAANCTKIAIGKNDGEMTVFDTKKIDTKKLSALMTCKLKHNKVVAVEYSPSSHEFIAVGGNQITVVDADKDLIQSHYEVSSLGPVELVGCTSAEAGIVAINWKGYCNEDKPDNVKFLTSVINLKKAESADQ